MTLVLFSGGLDSMVLAYMALEQNKPMGILHLSYQHPAASEEMASVMRWCIANNRPDLYRVFRTAPLEAMDLRSGPGKPGPRIVPARNDIFVSMAANVAVAHRFTEIWIGATAEDREYPDCSPEWLRAQNELLKSWGLTLKAPLLYMTREDIIEKALANRWLLDSWSCYEPINGQPCKTCNSCKQAQPPR